MGGGGVRPNSDIVLQFPPYVKDLNYHPPGYGLYFCEISLKSLRTAHIGKNKSHIFELLNIQKQGLEFCF